MSTEASPGGVAPLITILMVNYNSHDFIRLNLKALTSLSKHSFQVFICDNGSSPEDFNGLRRTCSSLPNVTLIARLQSSSGSMGHGEALDLMTRFIDTPYGAILDADCVPLRMHWDQILMEMLSGKTRIAGTPVASNSPNNVKPIDFPLMFLCLFESRTLKELGIRFLPGDIAAGQDTGWELRDKYLAAGLHGAVLHGENTRTYRNGPLSETVCDEYYLDGRREAIFCSHLGRGSAPNSGKYSRNQAAALKAYHKDKTAWLAACEALIEAESRLASDRETIPCDLCGGNDATKLFETPSFHGRFSGFWKLVKCPTCSLSYLNPRPRLEADHILASTHQAMASTVVSKMPAGLPAPREAGGTSGSLLEIGCGEGSRLERWKGEGWDVQGIEPDPGAAAKARGRGLTVKDFPLLAGSVAASSLDAIVLTLPLGGFHSPRKLLETLTAWLKPGGELLFSCMDWGSLEARLLGKDHPHLGIPGNLYQFSTATIHRYLQDYDVKIHHHSTYPDFLNGARRLALSGEAPSAGIYVRLPEKAQRALSKVVAALGQSGTMTVQARKK